MTTSKTSFIQGDDNIQKNQNAGSAVSEQDSAVGFAPSQEHVSAYLYDLLSPEESAVVAERVEQSASFQEALEASRQEQARFAYWADVPPPANLAENTLLRIQSLTKQSESSEPTA